MYLWLKFNVISRCSPLRISSNSEVCWLDLFWIVWLYCWCMGSWVDNRCSATDRPACTTRSRTSCSTDDYSRIPLRSENNWRRTGCPCSLDGCTSLHNHNEKTKVLNKSLFFYIFFNCLMYYYAVLKPHFPRHNGISR